MKKDNYEDIINLPHYVSLKHPQMSMDARASQFAPFAALTGYDDEIKETARLTDKRIEIDDGLKVVLNSKLQIIQENIKNNPEVTFTYFVYDKKKTGGKYITKMGIVKKININQQYILLMDKTKIPINEVINIQGCIFDMIRDNNLY